MVFKKGNIPWNKGKIGNYHSEETRKKMSEIKKEENHPFFGKHHTKESRQKISESNKGNIPWNKGKKNIYSEETLENISNTQQGCIPWNKGKIKVYSEETLEKMSEVRKGKYHTEETRQKISESQMSENNSNYIDGCSFEPYCERFNKILKEAIRERDNRICQECGKTELDNHQKLSIHHIHYDKENCYPDLISLCRICNSHANKNRDYWEEYFMNKLYKQFSLNRHFEGDI